MCLHSVWVADLVIYFGFYLLLILFDSITLSLFSFYLCFFLSNSTIFISYFFTIMCFVGDNIKFLLLLQVPCCDRNNKCWDTISCHLLYIFLYLFT